MRFSRLTSSTALVLAAFTLAATPLLRSADRASAQEAPTPPAAPMPAPFPAPGDSTPPAPDLPPAVTVPPQTSTPPTSAPSQAMPQGGSQATETAAPARDGRGTQTEARSETSPQRKIDDLLTALRRESNPEKARSIAAEIQSDWNQSGSATVDLLLQWASEAVEQKRNGAALDFLDQATLLAPDFTGAWNQRATLHYTMGDRRKAMADINEVLKREPRHFGAIAGMAAILLETDEDRLAEKALERYLAIYPADKEAREQMEKLAEKLAGSPT